MTGPRNLKGDASPVIFWDLFGKQGHPIRTTISEMGPLLLARLMNLNDTQEGVLNIMFRVAEDESMPMLDLDDLRSMAVAVSERSKELSSKYGNVASASVGAIQRRLLVLEDQGANQFFGYSAVPPTFTPLGVPTVSANGTADAGGCGDLDNDGLVDVFIGNSNADQVYRQDPLGTWLVAGVGGVEDDDTIHGGWYANAVSQTCGAIFALCEGLSSQVSVS